MNGQQDTDQTAGLEVQIRRTLLRRAESLEVTSADEERMKRSVHQRIEEESGMRKWSARKIAVVAAAACVLGSMTAVAAGKITHVSSHSYHTNDFTYEKLGRRRKGWDLQQKRRKLSATDTDSALVFLWNSPVWTRKGTLWKWGRPFP